MEINTGTKRIRGSNDFIEKVWSFIDDLNAWIEDTCDDMLIPLVDLNKIFRKEDDPNRLDPRYSVGDHAHLSLEGQKRLADAFYKNYFEGSEDFEVVVCLGDSHTQGYPMRTDISTNGIPVDPRRHSENQFPYWLAKRTGKTFINRGIAGNTVYGMRVRFHDEVIPHMPDHCIILGGTNDALLGTPLDDTESDLKKLYDSCIEADIIPVAATLIPMDL